MSGRDEGKPRPAVRARPTNAGAAGGAEPWSRAACRALRDQPESAFGAILRRLVSRVPGARAAVLVDLEGETVDYAGSADPYALRVAGAHWRILLEQVRSSRIGATWIAAVAGAVGFRIDALPDGYAVLLVLTPGVGLPSTCERATSACGAELAHEAGWGKEGDFPWYGLDVATDERLRPAALRRGSSIEPLEIIGRLAAGLRPREQGWRIRTVHGIEANLVRECGSRWYVDEFAVADLTTRDLEKLFDKAPTVTRVRRPSR